MKKYFSIILACVLLFTMSIPVYADETENEWYEMVFEEEGSPIDNEFEDEEPIIMPRTKYIMTVQTQIKYLGSKQVAMHVNVYCNSTVKSIITNLYLQKYSNGSWVSVAAGTVSVSNTNKLSKTATASGVSSGRYRVKSITKVTDSSGYSETLTEYSGSISF